MRATLTYDLGILGECEIQTDTGHGSPDGVFVDGTDLSDNGPFVELLMAALGDKLSNDLANYEDKVAADHGDRQRDDAIDREAV